MAGRGRVQKGPEPSALGDPCSQGGAESKQYDLLAGEMQCTGCSGLAIVCTALSTQRRAVCCGATGVAMTNVSGGSKGLGGRIGGNKGPSWVHNS